MKINGLDIILKIVLYFVLGQPSVCLGFFPLSPVDLFNGIQRSVFHRCSHF